MPQYKVVFLDFYGTLVRDDAEIIKRITRHIVDVSPLPCDERQVMRDWPFARHCDEAHGDKFRTQRAIEQEAIVEMFSKYKINACADDTRQELFAWWVSPEPYEDSYEFLQSVTLPVCIVSNIDNDDLYRAIDSAGFMIRHTVTSEDCHSYKPRPEVFQTALKLMGRAPHDVLHVGDSYRADVIGARSLGIDVAWVNRHNLPLPDNALEPTYMVKDLRELRAAADLR